ncbi:MAG: 4Fe-4S dicluster domain-containing protein [Pseudomonadota bacterium]
MRLGLTVDLDTCVGCHGCATACKQWNTSGTIGPLSDLQAYADEPDGPWLNRIRTFEVESESRSQTVHFPMSCLHCENADCVTVCPTGASYKRAEDGIVLVDQDKCMGCNLCAWACPYGARELDQDQGVMKKCTLCIDRIYDETLPEEDRQPACVLTCPTGSRKFGDFDDPDSEVSRLARERAGFDLMAELGYEPTNKYLPPRAPAKVETHAKATSDEGIKGWINKMIAR